MPYSPVSKTSIIKRDKEKYYRNKKTTKIRNEKIAKKGVLPWQDDQYVP